MPKLVSLLGMLLGLVAVAGMAAEAPKVAQVTAVSGQAEVMRATGPKEPLRPNTPVFNGDTVQTGSGEARLQFSDGGAVAVQRNSRFKVAEYRYNGAEDGTESAIFDLIRGGIRALSGAIGHRNPARYEMRTVVATIGIRGTAYEALFCQGDCTQTDGSALPDGLHVRTTSGAVEVRNKAGRLPVVKGLRAYVPNMLAPPRPSRFKPDFTHKGPPVSPPRQGDSGQGDRGPRDPRQAEPDPGQAGQGELRQGDSASGVSGPGRSGPPDPQTSTDRPEPPPATGVSSVRNANPAPALASPVNGAGSPTTPTPASSTSGVPAPRGLPTIGPVPSSTSPAANPSAGPGPGGATAGAPVRAGAPVNGAAKAAPRPPAH